MHRLLLVLFLFSCQQQAETSMATLQWLPGVWKMPTPDGVLVERWCRVNADTLRGQGYVLQGRDSLLIEDFEIYKNEDAQLVYGAKVKAQNDGKTIRYVAAGQKGDSIVFENPAHDFPQKIIYRRLSDSSFAAAIAGMQQGKYRRVDFHFSK